MKINLNPNVSKTIESLKSSGYSFASALCDIIDNSIDAKANNIYIYTDFKNIGISIIDDGVGMDKEAIIESLKLGSETGKDQNSLGKFGFGLKSASFSQCNTLIVGSKFENKYNEITFDTLEAIEKNDWIAEETSYYKESITPTTGTVIVWKDLYRFGKNREEKIASFEELYNDTKKYIGRTFYEHINNGINIFVDDLKVYPMSPFNEDATTTVLLNDEEIQYDNEIIRLRGYYQKKLNPEEGNALNNQGIYIFRNNRLISRINWLSFNVHQIYNSLRIRIDLGGKEDDILNLDYKKTSIEIPTIIKRDIQVFEKSLVKLRDSTNKKKSKASKEQQKELKIVKLENANKQMDARNLYVNQFSVANDIRLGELTKFFDDFKFLKKITNIEYLSTEEKEKLLDIIQNMYEITELSNEDFYMQLKKTEPFYKFDEVLINFRRTNE